MQYSREGFRLWLESLPKKPFCKQARCPISQFLGIPGGAGVTADQELAYAIDDSMEEVLEEKGEGLDGLYWDNILPSEVILVIDSFNTSKEDNYEYQ